MSSQESTVTLSIRETGTPPQRGFLYQVLVDGEVIASNQSLSPEQAKAVCDFSRRYGELFEHPHQSPQIAADNLKALGTQLFDVWLAPVWDKVKDKVPSGARRLLVIASDVPDVLNLPWELLRPTDGDFIGLDGKFGIRRLPWHDRRLAPFAGELPPRPLRILFMACAPKEQQQLNYEREEVGLLRAIARAGPNVAVDFGDMGTFDELRQRINDFKPHVVHITGHGILGDDGLGYFAFEDESGGTDLRSSEEIHRRLFAGSGVQCVFVSGCQTGKAPPVATLGGICQGLVSDEVPLAIGWAASVADSIATRFASVFYDTISSGETADRALTQARQEIADAAKDSGNPSWTLPVLYAATTQGPVFDPDPTRKAVPPPRPSMVQQPLEGMVEGYAEHFVGRRRELQRLLPTLRDGVLQAVLITGLGGAGKSTLATRLARRLEPDRFTPIAVPSSRETPLSAASLLEICGDAFLKAGLTDAHAMLGHASLSVEDRLHYIVGVLNDNRFVLVLDNFEVNLDEATRRTLDQNLASFYTHLLTHLSGGSRAIITCRYRPADVHKLPPTVHEEPLEDFPEASFLKFLLRDEAIERRYRAGELSQELLSELHRVLGGTPRFLDQIREVLRTIEAGELRRELAAVKLPDTKEPSRLRDARDLYCEKIFTARLYGNLSADSRRALSRVAVYGVPVNLDGLAAAAGEPVERLRAFTREWQDCALAYPETERAAKELWTTYGLLRSWLLAPERLAPEERREAHRAAGDFLRELDRQDRESELGLHWIACLMEARAQYLTGEDYEQAAAVTERINGFLHLHGLYDEVVRLSGEVLRYGEFPLMMSWIARAYDDRGEYSAARDWYRRCLEAARDTNPREAAVAWHGLATIDVEQGEYEAAREKFQKALEIEQETGDREGEAATWHQLAMIDMNQGDYEAAREKLQKALKTRQEIGDRAGEAATWHGLASIELEQGKYEAAREKFQKAMAFRQQIGDRAGEANTRHQLASIDLHQGDYEAAAEKFQKALETRQEIGDRYGEAATFFQLGILAAKVGRLAEGARLVALCFLIDQSIGHGDAEKDSRSLAGMATDLKYTPEQVQALLREVTQAYQKDRGRGLLDAAFG
jgi:tetratricopeptide (TPR) repeat protein